MFADLSATVRTAGDSTRFHRNVLMKERKYATTTGTRAAATRRVRYNSPRQSAVALKVRAQHSMFYNWVGLMYELFQILQNFRSCVGQVLRTLPAAEYRSVLENLHRRYGKAEPN